MMGRKKVKRNLDSFVFEIYTFFCTVKLSFCKVQVPIFLGYNSSTVKKRFNCVSKSR